MDVMASVRLDAAPAGTSPAESGYTRRATLRGGLYAASAVAMSRLGRFGDATAAAADAAPPKTGDALDHPSIGFVLTSEEFTGPELLELATGAEDAGFDAVWTSDHFLPWQENEQHAVQATVLLGAISQRTKRIRIGTGVTCPIYRYHPAIVAQSFATLSTFAPHRVFLGCGKCEALNEKAATGQWDKHAVRAARWIEAVEIIRALWTGEWLDHDGAYYHVHGKLYDPPVGTIPIYMAASGTKSSRIAGLYGDGWITAPKELLTAAKRAAFADGVKSSGRDPASVPIITEQWVIVGGKREAEEAASRWRFLPQSFKKYFTNPDPRAIERDAEANIPLESVYGDWPVSEDPDVHVQAITKLLDAGVSQVFVHSGQLDQRRVLDFYGNKVLPKLRAA